MKIAITGHRPNKLGNDYDLTSPLLANIQFEIEDILVGYRNEPKELITGMALGIDTLFAKIAIELEIPFIAAIPFKGQERMWPKKSQDLYHDILRKAASIKVMRVDGYCTYEWYKEELKSFPYIPILMQERNEWMVDNCDLLIAVWDNTSGGTANCVKYAKSKGKEIIYINPKEL